MDIAGCKTRANQKKDGSVRPSGCGPSLCLLDELPGCLKRLLGFALFLSRLGFALLMLR